MAKNTDKFPIMILSLNQIVVDHEIQSRESMSVDHQRKFSEAMIEGREFPAVVVFFDGKKYWLADGFHRVAAANVASKINRELLGIKAEVREGDRRDALIYSAGANQEFSIERTNEDKAKAVLILMRDSEWFRYSNSVIARHVGVSQGFVAKVRLSYCEKAKVPIPEEVKDCAGSMRPYSVPKKTGTFRAKVLGSRGVGFHVHIAGEKHHLGQSLESAQFKALGLASQANAAVESRGSIIRNFASWLTNRKIRNWSSSSNSHDGMGNSIIVSGCVVVAHLDSSRASLPEPIGRVLLGREKHMPGGRAVVVMLDVPDCEAVEMARRLGVEFMTPDEFSESVNNVS